MDALIHKHPFAFFLVASAAINVGFVLILRGIAKQQEVQP